jgi:flagellar basal-body rod protein FlgC
MTSITPISGSGPLTQSMATAASAMRAESMRLRLVAENLANANTTGAGPGEQPYQRKLMTFQQSIDQATGAATVEPGPITTDQTPFRTVYDPSHPAADANGYVSLPNVSELVEVADMREAQRSYEANLASLSQSRSMISKTLDLLKA